MHFRKPSISYVMIHDIGIEEVDSLEIFVISSAPFLFFLLWKFHVTKLERIFFRDILQLWRNRSFRQIIRREKTTWQNEIWFFFFARKSSFLFHIKRKSASSCYLNDAHIFKNFTNKKSSNAPNVALQNVFFNACAEMLCTTIYYSLLQKCDAQWSIILYYSQVKCNGVKCLE